MNKAITEGFELMPPPFAAGFEVWSQGDGTPGTPTWAQADTATLVSSDAQFGRCLEIRKATDQMRVRYAGETPILPGCYLRISARVKVLSGPLPSVRIGGWAGGVGGERIGGLSETGPLTEIDAYGEVFEVSAIVGSGSRGGVDMVWGCRALYGHFGLDFSGPTGSVIRIEDLRIEDVTTLYLRRMMDWVDVRDFGARGDGLTDDSAAFRAADAAARGRRLLVPDGVFWLAEDVVLRAETRFQGRVRMPDAASLTLARTVSLDAYCDAFADPELGLRKALQCLLRSADLEVLDMCGRTVTLSAPLDLREISGGPNAPETRRILRNGRLLCAPGTGWDTTRVTAKAVYSPDTPLELHAVDGIARIAPGSLVEGAGVGREVYVRAVDVAAGRVTLSQPLHGAQDRQSYVFRRFQYALDFSGFERLSEVTLQNVELRLNGQASGILLAPDGEGFAVEGCDIARPRDRAITSHGGGCRSLRVERCQFLSAEVDLNRPARKSVGINVNSEGARIRDNRAVRFRHFLVAHGTGHVIDGNHLLQGDGRAKRAGSVGMVLTSARAVSRVTGNHMDACGLEWTNEHDAAPDWDGGPTFGGLAVTGNIFTVEGADPAFRFVQIRPFGAGHGLEGLSVTDNLFTAREGLIDQVEGVDASITPLDLDRVRNVTFDANTFEGIARVTETQVTLQLAQDTHARFWVLDTTTALPFAARARAVVGVVADAELTGRTGTAIHALPVVKFDHGPGRDEVRLTWPEPCCGRVHITLRPDPVA